MWVAMEKFDSSAVSSLARFPTFSRIWPSIPPRGLVEGGTLAHYPNSGYESRLASSACGQNGENLGPIWVQVTSVVDNMIHKAIRLVNEIR